MSEPQSQPNSTEHSASGGNEVVGRPIPKEIDDLRADWWKYFHRWWFIHYALGILGTTSSVTVASWPQNDIHIPYMLGALSWIAAVCIALLTFLMPSRRAKAYVGAWRILHSACTKYSLDETVVATSLVDAIERGEQLIGNADPS